MTPQKTCDWKKKRKIELGVLAHSCNLATERLGLLGCVRLVGHIPLSEGWTSVRIIKLKDDVVTPGAGYARGPYKGPLSGPELGVSDI